MNLEWFLTRTAGTLRRSTVGLLYFSIISALSCPDLFVCFPCRWWLRLPSFYPPRSQRQQVRRREPQQPKVQRKSKGPNPERRTASRRLALSAGGDDRHPTVLPNRQFRYCQLGKSPEV